MSGDALLEVLTRASATLAAAGVESPRREARLLANLAIGISLEGQLAEPRIPVGAAEKAHLCRLVRRRAIREPFAYIASVREFMGIELESTPAALVPRPETESVVEGILTDGEAARVLDLGTGSGAILTTLLTCWPKASGVGVDYSEAALRLAHRNAVRHGVWERASFVVSNWCEALGDGTDFDLVVCNPPYVCTEEIALLEPEVSLHEPKLALDGGPDGLSSSRAALAGIGRILRSQARIVFETDPRLWDGLRCLFEEAGIVDCRPLFDLTGRRRGIFGVFRPDG